MADVYIRSRSVWRLPKVIDDCRATRGRPQFLGKVTFIAAFFQAIGRPLEAVADEVWPLDAWHPLFFRLSPMLRALMTMLPEMVTILSAVAVCLLVSKSAAAESKIPVAPVASSLLLSVCFSRHRFSGLPLLWIYFSPSFSWRHRYVTVCCWLLRYDVCECISLCATRSVRVYLLWVMTYDDDDDDDRPTDE